MATVDEILTARAYAVNDEIWTADNSYPSNRLYVEPEYVPVTNKRIADFNDQISVYGEQNVQFVGFQLPRYDDGIDLTVQNLYIHYQTAHGGSDSVPCNVSWSDNYVRLLWEIPGQATQQPGTIQVMIYATSTSSTGVRTVWKTLPATYTIHDGLEIGGGIPEPDHSWYEQFVQQMENRVSTALGYANDAQASKTAAADSATDSAKSATASARALEENKAYVESQKEAFAGYNRRETDLKYANALIDSASGTTQVTVSDAWEAPIPGLEIGGKSEQGADPSPDNPQEIVSTDVTAVTVTGANMSKTAAITLTEPLRGIGDYRDRIMCRGGVWGVERNRKTVLYDGVIKGAFGLNSQWDTLYPGFMHCAITKIDDWLVGQKNFISNKFLCTTQQNRNFTNIELSCHTENNGLYLFIGDEMVGIYDKDDKEARIEKVNNWIQSNNFMVEYSTATPAWEPLPAAAQSALNALTTYTGQTTITVTADGPEPDMKLEYVQDTRMVIADLQAQIDAIRNGGTT